MLIGVGMFGFGIVQGPAEKGAQTQEVSPMVLYGALGYSIAAAVMLEPAPSSMGKTSPDDRPRPKESACDA